MQDLPESARIDRIEFDVVLKEDRILVAHDLKSIDSNTLTLQESLPLLLSYDLPLMCDLKSYTPSFLCRVAEAFSQEDIPDTIFSSHLAQDARWLARQIPGSRSSWSVPQVGLAGVTVPAPSSHQTMIEWRETILIRLAPVMHFPLADILSVQFEWVTPGLIELAHRHNKQVYAWTVNEQQVIKELQTQHADGIVSDHPELAI